MLSKIQFPRAFVGSALYPDINFIKKISDAIREGRTTQHRLLSFYVNLFSKTQFPKGCVGSALPWHKVEGMQNS